jgi:effector-binding domain-containing protein
MPVQAVNPNRTLADKPGDPSDVDDLTLTSRPALSQSGRTTWERGLQDLSAAHERLATEARRLGLAVAGRPVTIYQETDDTGFRYDALLPVDRAPDPAAPQGETKAGATPSGRALRFVHRGAYDDIDATYEGITAYLDAKGVTVRDQFAEEFVITPKDPADTGAEVNIYVQPR